jgi:putative hydrolase of the HAD superfamily
MSRGEGWAVFFDAVGTLIHPDPEPASVYHRVGRSFGSKLDLDTVRERFRQAWQTQDQLDRMLDWQTNEGREETRWRTIVAETLFDVSSPEDCFLTLYDYFARREAWRLDPQVVSLLRYLALKGYQLGICSNFDSRLRSIVTAMPKLKIMHHLVISSEVGCRKPAKVFFKRVQECVGLEPSRIIMVGDDLTNDYEGADRFGMVPVLVNQKKPRQVENHIHTWNELIELLDHLDDQFT